MSGAFAGVTVDDLRRALTPPHPDFKNPQEQAEDHAKPIPGVEVNEPGVLWRWDMFVGNQWCDGKRMFMTVREAQDYKESDPFLAEQRNMTLTAIVLTRE